MICRPSVHTGNKVEFDSLSRSTLSPTKSTVSNSTLLSPVCTGLNGHANKPCRDLLVTYHSDGVSDGALVTSVCRDEHS